MARLKLTRSQILSFRRHVGGLDERQDRSEGSLREAAWAGLQDSMPRAAVLSIHARLEGTDPTAWEDPSLVQLWGPRFSAYVVPECDRSLYTLGRLPDDEARRDRANDLADRLCRLLDGRSMTYGQAGRELGEPPNRLRYAAPTGRVLIRWDGARQPTISAVPAPDVDPRRARHELARRYLHVFGPTTAAAFSQWAGIPRASATATFVALRDSLAPVRTPMGDAWILASDEDGMTSTDARPAPARLLPSGDAYFLLHGGDRRLLVPDGDRQKLLWTPRVWPGAVLAGGEIVGTWRRSKNTVSLAMWRRINDADRDEIAEEARSLTLPLFDATTAIRLHWTD